MKKLNRVLWGVVLMVLGLIWAVNATGLMRIEIFFPGWWTLFIIVPAIISLATEGDKGGSTFMLVLGILLLLACQNVVGFGIIWKLILPVIVILIGVGMIVRAVSGSKVCQVHEAHQREHTQKIKEGEVVNDDPEYWATFGGVRTELGGKELKDCRAEAVFGSLVLDLTDAKMPKEVTMKANAIFGSVKVIVPEDVAVEVSPTSVFGGVNNKHRKLKKTEKAKATLYIEAMAVFGGVEIQ